MGGERPPAQEAPTVTHGSDKDREAVLYSLYTAYGKGMVSDWLYAALQSHRFVPPGSEETMSIKRLIKDTRSYLILAVHPDKIPLGWKDSPEHSAAATAMFPLLHDALNYRLKECEAHPTGQHTKVRPPPPPRAKASPLPQRSESRSLSRSAGRANPSEYVPRWCQTENCKPLL